MNITDQTSCIELSDLEIKLSFVAHCIESLSRRMGCGYTKVVSAFKRSNIVDDYLFPHYNTLHTQSWEYVLDDIMEYMKNRGVSV